LAREKANGNLQFPALFVGDSKYDFEAATRAGLDFVFLSGWTEVQDWKTYCAEKILLCSIPLSNYANRIALVQLKIWKVE